MRRAPPAPITGRAVLHLGRASHEVGFQLHIDARRGHLTGEPATMADAFRRGEGRLRPEGGEELALTFVAHTAGSNAVFFETPKKQVAPTRLPGGVSLPPGPKRPPAS